VPLERPEHAGDVAVSQEPPRVGPLPYIRVDLLTWTTRPFLGVAFAGNQKECPVDWTRGVFGTFCTGGASNSVKA